MSRHSSPCSWASASAAPKGIDPVFEPAVAALGAALAGLLGCFLGWFNVTILFRVPASVVVQGRGEA